MRDEASGDAVLAALHPRHVPAPLAVDAERGWMVLDDFRAEVGWQVAVEVVEGVARTFARMQVETAPHVERRSCTPSTPRPG